MDYPFIEMLNRITGYYQLIRFLLQWEGVNMKQ